MQNVLITGVTGFAGSSLVSYLSSQHDVTLYGHSRDVVKAKNKFIGDKIEIIEECSHEKLDALKINCIIHLAGIAHDLSNTFVDDDYYRVNFEGTAKLYDEFLKSEAGLFIYFSSIKAAVDNITTPLNENYPPSPITPYGKSKLMAEDYITAHATAPKRFLILRPCMIHGPGNKGNLNLLHRFVRRGLPYPLGAFENRRSFLNADNLNFIIGNCLQKTINNGIYNLADDGSISTANVVKVIATTVGKRPLIWRIPKLLMTSLFSVIGKRKMLAKLVDDMEVSNKKIITALGVSLPVSIEEGLKRTIKSFNE